MSRRLQLWIATAAVVGAIALSGEIWWIVESTRSTTDVTAKLQAWAEQQPGYADDVTIDCPPFVRWSVGKTFHCTVTEGVHTDLNGIVVTIQDDDGGVTWSGG